MKRNSPPQKKPKNYNNKNPNKQQQNTDYLSLRKSEREKAKKKNQNIEDKVLLTFLLKDCNLAKSVIGRLLPKHI